MLVHKKSVKFMMTDTKMYPSHSVTYDQASTMSSTKIKHSLDMQSYWYGL